MTSISIADCSRLVYFFQLLLLLIVISLSLSFVISLQISGSLDAIRKALLCVSQQILEHPPQDDELLSLNTSGPSSQSSGHPFSRQEPNYHFSSQGPPYFGSRDSESGNLGRNNPSQDILTFRLLCPDEKAGGVIGKGGSIVKALQHESGCEIKVLDGVSGSEDRIIIISGPSV